MYTATLFPDAIGFWSVKLGLTTPASAFKVGIDPLLELLSTLGRAALPFIGALIIEPLRSLRSGDGCPRSENTMAPELAGSFDLCGLLFANSAGTDGSGWPADQDERGNL